MKKDGVISELLSRCGKIKSPFLEIERLCEEIETERIKEDISRFVSYDYAMTAKLLSQGASFEKREQTRDTSTETALEKALGEITDAETCCVVFGQRKKSIAIGSPRGDILKKYASEIHESFEKVCGSRLTLPEFCRTANTVIMKMQTAKAFEVEYATAKAPTKSGEVSGDFAKCFSTKENFFYGVISDGMGTGERAAETAETAVSVTEKLLSAGAGKSLTLRTLNNLLRVKKPECSATVDLFELDQVYGKGTFLKCGAAPSYI